MRGTLYLVATPIGNLGDITLRALETLKQVDCIACEDTRHTLQLLNHFEIKKPLISYYKQKEQEGSVQIMNLLDEGKNIALVSDAGMPCISDPGSVLVRKLLENGYSYTIIPGANACVSAIALTGVEGPFTFIGFLPEKNKERIDLLRSFKESSSNLVVYVAPHDVNRVLDDLFSALGDRKLGVVKEITKIHETVMIGSLQETRIESPKGEYVLVIGPEDKVQVMTSDADIKNKLVELISNGISKKDAIKEITNKYNVSKNLVYKLSLEI